MDALAIDLSQVQNLYQEWDWSSALLDMNKIDRESWSRQMLKLREAESRISSGTYNKCAKCGRELLLVTRTAKHETHCPYCDGSG